MKYLRCLQMSQGMKLDILQRWLVEQDPWQQSSAGAADGTITNSSQESTLSV